jgi:hypothetical protein
MSDDEASQSAVLSAIELSSGWDAADITHARQEFTQRAARPNAWRECASDPGSGSVSR